MNDATQHNTVQMTDISIASHDPIMDLIAVQMNKIEPSAENKHQDTQTITTHADVSMATEVFNLSNMTPSIIVISAFIIGHLIINYLCTPHKEKTDR